MGIQPGMRSNLEETEPSNYEVVDEIRLLREYTQGEFGRLGDRLSLLDRGLARLEDRYVDSQDKLREYLGDLIEEQRQEQRLRYERWERCFSGLEGIASRLTSKPILVLTILTLLTAIAGATGVGVVVGDFFSAMPSR